jgi:DNA-binding transcriptional ArsR family regulator
MFPLFLHRSYLLGSPYYGVSVWGMSGSEEETYSTMFSSLKHPARRKILRMLSEKPMTFSQMLEELGISSSHLTYQLESLGELISKLEDGKYKLSSFGEASVNTMKGVEEVPETSSKRLSSLPFSWKAVFTALIIGVVVIASFSVIQFASLDKLSKDQELLKAELDHARAENQQLLSWSIGTDKAIAFIRDVIQIDIKKYQASLLSDNVQYRSDLGGVLEEVLKYSLVNSESKIDVILRFRNNHFSRYQLYIDEGAPIYSQSQSNDALTATRALVERYKGIISDAYLQDMSSLMASVNNSNGNSTVLNHSKLQITSSGESDEILLMYTENGVDFSAKSLRLFFQNHILNELTDGWFLLTVASTQVNISEMQAVQIAENHVKTFKWNVNGTQVSNFTVLETKVTAQFVPHPRGEFLALVPYWYVTLPLDKVYPGEVNRITVGVWADTGEIANAQALGG